VDPTARAAVRTTVAVLARLARRTRTPADDLLAQMLRANEDRIVAAVTDLLAQPGQPPSDDDIATALKRVGIDVQG
jgi:hypothetical protein